MTEGPDPRLLQKAIDDRAAHPWRYYRFEWEDCKKWLDKLAARAEKAEAELAELRAKGTATSAPAAQDEEN